MSAMIIAKWTTKEIKDELRELLRLRPVAHFIKRSQLRYITYSDQLVNTRRITFVLLTQWPEVLKEIAQKMERFEGFQKVIVKRWNNLDYFYFRIYIKNEYFQKRGE